MRREMLQISVIVSFCMAAYAQDSPIRVDFSATMPAEVIGAGFGTLPKADISYGSIRTDNAFEGATDGVGATVVADPGEGVMIYGQTLTTPHAAIIRCSVRADGPEAEVTIVAVDRNWQYFTTSGPVDSSPLTDRYRRVSVLYVPPTTGFTPILQVYNPSETTTVTVYVDNFDVYLLTPGRYYDTEFLDGDEVDPAVISIEPGGVEPLPTPPPLEGTETLLYDSTLYDPLYGPVLIPVRVVRKVGWESDEKILSLIEITVTLKDGNQLAPGFKGSTFEIKLKGTRNLSPPPIYIASEWVDVVFPEGSIQLALPFGIDADYRNVSFRAINFDRGAADIFPGHFTTGKLEKVIEAIGETLVGAVPYASIIMLGDSIATTLLENSSQNPLRGSLFTNLNNYHIMSGTWNKTILDKYFYEALDPYARSRPNEIIVRFPVSQTRNEVLARLMAPNPGVSVFANIDIDYVGFDEDVLDANGNPRPDFIPFGADPGLLVDGITWDPENPITPQPEPGPGFTGEEITIPIPGLPAGAKPLEMVLIPAGTFLMGSPSNEKDRYSDEGPQHDVTITKPFYLGKYEVTVGQYAAFLRATGKETGVDWSDSDCPLTRSGGNYELRGTFGQSWDQPMVEVSWYGAAMFCNYMSEKEGLQPVYDESSWEADLNANGYRLPTEAEWEYACRAGTTTRFYWGDDLNYTRIGDYAWYGGNNSPSGTKEIGLKLPNDWGLYDMSGNVWEWCHDWHGSYPSQPQVDPTGQQSGSHRVIRGGSWLSGAGGCRSAGRYRSGPSSSDGSVGFRVVLFSSRTP